MAARLRAAGEEAGEEAAGAGGDIDGMEARVELMEVF